MGGFIIASSRINRFLTCGTFQRYGSANMVKVYILHSSREKDCFNMSAQAINAVRALAECQGVFCDEIIKKLKAKNSR
ncbi:hypothetical protein HYPSUDRAFT_201798 [Hypholoma sublateritium FD-334 SS-4]|uniref:Uncharacterized protein n=1 Tax=Hypholoma sublateritium (strain FD-334 SS-4) TaxID=945553 RepID=A0A0D2P2Q3_HYPSF|nr:hypothetical protein HYPSUDRAFT_201798 [Hypholoma sublateritium FD-334 SS-4]